MVALDCGVGFGASGAPVLVGAKAGWLLWAVVSSTGSVVADGAPVTLAVEAADFVAPLRERLAPDLPAALPAGD